MYFYSVEIKWEFYSVEIKRGNEMVMKEPG